MISLAVPDAYELIKTLHVVSSTILFGAGLGTAFFFWSSRNADDAAKLFAARTTVRADLLFTLPAMLVQPLTGAWMIARAGIDPAELWLVISYLLYVAAGLCWLPVVCLQIQMKRMLEARAAGGQFDRARFSALRRTWFLLGWPAFLGLLFVFFLMVVKPSW